jgi:hypothetical protein
VTTRATAKRPACSSLSTSAKAINAP